ncbi:MAG TPA: ATP-binding protein [Variovorax sp.]|nr:ATP-binding protein [Variovorax sp.]
MSGVEQGGRLQVATGIRNMQQLIQLRWIAVVGQVVTILVVHYGLGIRLPLHQMLVVLACLAAFNAASQLRWRAHHEVTNTELFAVLLVDVGMLTAQLYLSGGATNPFVFLFLLQVVLGAMLLDIRFTWALFGVTTACFVGLALFAKPLALPLDAERGLGSPFILGLFICFALVAALTVVFVARINRNLRRRDARLADLRQRAAEEEHIVRMGLLASGAAHELGTPLATLSVILGDWQHMAPFDSNPELQGEVSEMQAQVQRCKSIVSGILLSAGEARGESSERTSVIEFLDEVVDDWRTSRAARTFTYSNNFGHDLPIVSDSALKQMIHNVLDNALEASPHWVMFEVSRHGDELVLTCTDAGPGFEARMLAQFGKPYQSSKGRAGGGLGLFLVVNVARTLGGRVEARNKAEGGAIVTITLPLASIVLESEEEVDDLE